MRKQAEFIRGGGRYKRYVLLIIVAVFTGLLMLFTFEYEDVDSLTAWSLNFWDLFFKGRLDEFYVYTAQNIRGAVHENCGGNYLWILPLCVWNLPLWVIHSLRGTLLATDFLSICWTKLFLYLLHIVTAYVSGKICAMMTSDRKKIILTMLLVLASPEILLSVGYTGQDEIVYICFFIVSFYCFLKNDWKKCYLCMVCCVTLCPIMILPVLAVLLIREKRISRLLLYMLGTIVPLLLFEVIYRKDLIYQEVKHANDFVHLIQEMLQGSTISTNWGDLSIAGMILCLVYFICYFAQGSQDEDEYNKKAIYIMAVIFATISFGMVTDFYRMFLYVPFLVIVLMISGQDMGVNLFLFTGITYGRILQAAGDNYPKSLNSIYIMKHSWITALCESMGKNKHLDSLEDSVCLWSYMIRLREALEPFCLIIETCVMGAVVILLVINSHRYTKRYETKMSQGMLLVVYTLCMPFVMICYYYMILH